MVLRVPRNTKLHDGQNFIPENLDFLRNLIALAQTESRNNPGPYWARTAKHSIREIRKKGLSSFRDFGSNVGESYADAPIVDIRPQLQGPLKSIVRFLVAVLIPFNRLLNNQVNLTSSIYKILLEKESAHLQNEPRVVAALARYSIPTESTRGHCVAVTKIDGVEHSNYYLEGLALIDKVEREIGFGDVGSYMEIGAGFGANIHLMIENFPTIRKFLVVDICPTLYVSTQYLKSFYVDNVIDAVSYSKGKNNQFKDNQDLEIICILPHQLREFHGVVDFFYNAHSFVEMTNEIVSGYVADIHRLQTHSDVKKIALCTYQAQDSEKTVSYKELPELFGLTMREVSDTWPRDGYNLNTFYFSAYGITANT